MEVFDKLKQAHENGQLSDALYTVLDEFYRSYADAANLAGHPDDSIHAVLLEIVQLTLNCVEQAPHFEPYHQKRPHEYKIGVDFWRQAIALEHSVLRGQEHIEQMLEQLKKGENVILFGNHQTEPDPQILSILLEEDFPSIAEEIIFVAGSRVTSDPVAAPFSLGRNLLCIHSKRHLEDEVELREQQLHHNQRTMKQMSRLLSDGGQCIYVAPSGGRDRRNSEGQIDVAGFDGQSLEMFLLMAQRAKTPTHFYPLSLHTYHVLPPPPTIDKALGERRVVAHAPVGAAFGPELDLQDAPGQKLSDKKARRVAKAEWIWGMVNAGHEQLIKALEVK